MTEVCIVGAGGYGRVALSQMLDDAAYGKEWRIAGFLDSRRDVLDGYVTGYEIIGDPLTYVPRRQDVFVCAIGQPSFRPTYVLPLLAKGAHFINILTEAYIARNVTIGQGCFMERRVTIGPDCRLGNFVVLHSLSVLGHDVVVGDYSQISCFCFVGGGAEIGTGVTVFPHATILPGRRIGDGATIGAGSVVLNDVPPGATVFGNPARRIS